MIQTLNIENVALIDKATLNFCDLLNVISGETGAGKSIMLDSLSFVFGERADRSLIRSGENQMKVEAIFTNINQTIKQKIEDQFNIKCDDELFLSRQLDISGRNVCKINGELVSVTEVKKICSMLVDLHGQSEHLAILNNDYQLHIVDLFSENAGKILKELNIEIEKLKEIEKNIQQLGGNEQEKQNLIDLYSYQIQEIENAAILPNEFESLTSEKKEMTQFAKINDAISQCLAATENNSFGKSAYDSLAEAKHSLQNIASLSSKYSDIFDRLNGVLIEVEDINQTLNDYLISNNFDEEKFNLIDSRLDLINSIFRKYGGNFENLNKYYDEINKKLNNLKNSEEKYIELNQKKQKILENIENIQQNLSETRKKSAKSLAEQMERELKTLGMPNARIGVEFSRITEPYSTVGFDHVEFMFSSNLGFELKPLNKVVSGGEMSRVMLAYKIVVSSVDDISTIIFDEIDSGLSGNIAIVVAEYMARLAKNKQIIAISHLPQICAMADENIKVEKYSDSVTTHTRATELFGDDLIAEISRLMGAGGSELEAQVGKNLKQKCEIYKNNLKNC